jgi:hypothetical protein
LKQVMITVLMNAITRSKINSTINVTISSLEQ